MSAITAAARTSAEPGGNPDQGLSEAPGGAPAAAERVAYRGW